MRAAREIDRRCWYAAMLLAVTLPLVLPPLPLGRPQPETRAYFSAIDTAATSGRPLLLSVDYTPETDPEVGPIAKATLRHVLARGGRCVVFTPHQDSAGLAASLCEDLLNEPSMQAAGKRYGVDLVYLGFKPEIRPLILGMAHRIRDNFPVDAYNTSLDDLVLTRTIDRLADFELVVSMSADDLSLDWITFGNGRCGARLAFGVASNFYGTIKPFVESGQVECLVRGMKGASEYERLLKDDGVVAELGDGTRGMSSQSAAHLLILLLIVLGNLGSRRPRVEP